MPSTPPSTHPIQWHEGTPFSSIYGDRFYSRAGAVEERELVFLAGNDLPRRFAACQGTETFVVGETGFGTGLNFLLTAELWLRSAAPTAHLHYLSVEAHPLELADLRACHDQWPQLAQASCELLPHWPRLQPGSNTLRLCDDRITLQLVVGDVSELGRYSPRCDAWYLDGFAPDRNPVMWSEATMRMVAHHTRAGGTCATYSAAGHMRRALQSFGFTMQRHPGHGGKRHRTVGVLQVPPSEPDARPWFTAPATPQPRMALVLGAGLAGAWLAHGLAQRGCAVTVADPAGIARGSSGNPAAIVTAQVSANDNTVHAWHAAGFALTSLRLHNHPSYDACGVLHCAVDADSAQQCQQMLSWWKVPPGVARWVEAAQTLDLAGLPVTHSGLWFSAGGVLRPAQLCQALLQHPNIRVTTDIAALPGGDYDAICVATAFAPATLPWALQLPIDPARGQLESVMSSPTSQQLRCVLSGAGYIVPAREGLHAVGASYVRQSTDMEPSPAEQHENLTRVRLLLDVVLGELHSSRVSLRATTPDHLPIVGPVPDWDKYAAIYGDLVRGKPGRDYGPAPYQNKLWVSLAHGSRGAVSAPLAAELLIAQLYGAPLPVPQSLAQAVHPGRFAIRAWRSGRAYNY